MFRLSTVILSLGVIVGLASHFESQTAEQPRKLERSEILAAMRLQNGYSITATTNGPRFKASVMLQLSRWARDREPNGSLLLIDYEDMFQAYLETTQLTEETAPVFIRLPHQHRQSFLIDSRKDRVVKTVIKGPTPDLALNIKEFWPNTPDLPKKYSYVDPLSTPSLAMTTERVVTYRLLEMGDMIILDEIRGLSGRPTSGVLGLVLRVLGEADASRSRSILLSSGVVVTRAEVKKGFRVARNVTMYPDGRTEDGLPADVPDIANIKNRLEQPIEIDYVPLRFP
jgi:hypothetical protein